ncbi:hypothetical protein HYX10_03445 [Candidatus Woesearchaeota archaeon]|nr:hypothetical protein [Candidatus Woesearchaeota archaeon]
MELIEDIESERRLIESAVAAYGSAPEHNFGYYLAHNAVELKGDECIYIREGKYGLLTINNAAAKKWSMIGAPLAPEAQQAQLVREALDFLKQKRKLNKFVAELTMDRKKIVDDAVSSSYKISDPNCVLYWPVYDMTGWEGDKLRGGLWKKMRNILNRFRKSHRIRIVDSSSVEKDDLKAVVEEWKLRRRVTGYYVHRKNSNYTDTDFYNKFIDLDFAGCNLAKSVLVDGKVASITAGWNVPNALGAYYSAVGIYDSRIECLGEYANWNDLVTLKKMGYSEVDFGGSPKPLLQFKQKFKPSRIYATYVYAITKK